MIFLTVGTQLPFERLVQTVDQWAGQNGSLEIIAQIGQTQYRPTHMQVVNSLSPLEYDQLLDRCELVIGHVGMGTIISCLMKHKPMVLMPRLERFGEHRNDHQIDTAKKLNRFESMQVAWSESELTTLLDKGLQSGLPQSSSQAPQLSASLKSALQGFVATVEQERA